MFVTTSSMGQITAQRYKHERVTKIAYALDRTGLIGLHRPKLFSGLPSALGQTVQSAPDQRRFWRQAFP